MSIITSISISNENWEYIREKKLSPTSLFKIGLERERNMSLVKRDEFDNPLDDVIELKKKVTNLIGALTVVTERAERAEAMLRNEQIYRRDTNV